MDVTKSCRALLAATDDSPEARHALGCALHLARDLGAKLYALYVIDSHAARSLGVHRQEGIREMAAEGKEAIQSLLRQAEELGVEAEGLLAEGRPGEEICRLAKHCRADIVVIGVKGKSLIEEALLGDVSRHVLHHAKQPVLVVRGEGHGQYGV
ncbi:MAG: universal stress protein [Chloroflexi bacterium]|nr:universal stress protein [Chloroflexota bacterium]MCL5110724.1 universal stress protein [Chloroflexota bacterium]